MNQSEPGSHSRNAEGPDVAIVGGGLSGLATAVALLQEGYSVTVIEKLERLGGRARSWRDEKTGDPVHIGPHIIPGKYPNFFKLLNEVGSDRNITWQDGSHITIAEQDETIEVDPVSWLPAPFSLIPAQLFSDRYSFAEVASNAPAIAYALLMDDEDIQRLDQMNAYAFLKMLGVRDSVINQDWRFNCRAIMNVPLEYCSAGALMNFFKHFVSMKDHSVGFPEQGLGELFAPDAKEFLRNHERGELRLETEVSELLGDSNQVDGLKLENGEELYPDRTVLGLTAPQCLTLLPRKWQKKYSYFSDFGFFEPCRYISPYLWFDRKITDMKFWARRYRYEDLNLDFYDMSNIGDDINDNNSLITSNIIYTDRLGDLSDEQVVSETVEELSELFPEVDESQVIHSVVSRVPLAIHCPFPGTQQRRPDPESPVENLYITGDWINTGIPSSMESAAKGGWLTAESILEADGKKSSLAKPVEGHGDIPKWINKIGQREPFRRIRKLIPPL
jgi:15-cis-phytoene desaturase